MEEAEGWLVKNQPAEFREALLALYFQIHSFRRTAELYDERFVTIIESTPDVKVRQFCLDPSLLLRKALARGKAAIFFSATLTPMDYYRTLLGGEPEDPVLQLSSPFPPEHLAVLIQDRIQTHFKGRVESLGDVVEVDDRFLESFTGMAAPNNFSAKWQQKIVRHTFFQNIPIMSMWGSFFQIESVSPPSQAREPPVLKRRIRQICWPKKPR
jgi:hypothetical protein